MELSDQQQSEFLEFANAAAIDYVNGQGPNQFFSDLSSSDPELDQPNAPALDVTSLIVDEDSNWKGHISSYEEHLRIKDAYMRLNNEELRGNILGFPDNSEGQKELVRQLYQAMRNMDGILDGARLSRKRRHVDEEETFSQSVSIDRFEDSVAVKRVKDIKGIELEILGWDLLVCYLIFKDQRTTS